MKIVDIVKSKKFKLFLIYFVLAFIAMLPTSLHPTIYKWGNIKGSDSLMMSYAFWRDTEIDTRLPDGTPWNYLRAAPEGIKINTRVNIPQILALPVTKLFTPVFSYNLFIFISFLLSGVFTHLLIYSLCKCRFSSLLGGFVFMFSPFHMIQSADHINLAQTWVFPAFLIIFIKFMRDKSYWSVTVLSLFINFSLFLHGYYGLFLIIVAISFILYMLIDKQLSLADKQTYLLALAFLAPLIIGILGWLSDTGFVKIEHGGSISMFSRPFKDLYTYGIRWYEFLLPPYHSLFFGEAVLNFLRENHHGSNFAEMTLFLGYLPLIMAVWFFYYRMKNSRHISSSIQEQIPTQTKKRKKKQIKVAQQVVIIDSKIVWLLSIITVIPFFLGVSPEISIFGIKIPTLTTLSHLVLPMLRTLSRFGILTIFAISCFASLGFYYIINRFSLTQKRLITSICVLFIYVEFTNIHNSFYLDASQVPEVYEEVKKIDKPITILELPFEWGYMPTFWQSYHQKKIFNYFVPSHPRFKEILRIQKIRNLMEILRICQKREIDYLIIHSQKPIKIGKSFQNDLNDKVILPRYANYSTLIKAR